MDHVIPTPTTDTIDFLLHHFRVELFFLGLLCVYVLFQLLGRFVWRSYEYLSKKIDNLFEHRSDVSDEHQGPSETDDPKKK